MTAEVIDFVALLDEQGERAAQKLVNEPELHCDGGQALYNELPRELQKAFVHLAFLMKDAPVAAHEVDRRGCRISQGRYRLCAVHDGLDSLA